MRHGETNARDRDAIADGGPDERCARSDGERVVARMIRFGHEDVALFLYDTGKHVVTPWSAG